MKSRIVILFIIFAQQNLPAQLQDIITGIGEPGEMALHGDTMFVIENNTNKILKFNINDPNPVAELYYSSAENLTCGLIIKDDILYFTTDHFTGKINKVDLNAGPGSVTGLISGLILPYGMYIDGNTMYYSEVTPGTISKIDLTVNPPVPVVVCSGLTYPFDIELIGTDLYIAGYGDDKLIKADLTVQPATTANVVHVPSATDLIRNGNNLYVASFYGQKVYTVDYTSSSPVANDFVSGVQCPAGLEIYANRLFISEQCSDKITEIAISLYEPTDTTSNDSLLIKKRDVFPNPAIDYIQLFKAPANSGYIIYDDAGRIFLEGILPDNRRIAIQSLAGGVYLIRLSDNTIYRFVKI